MPRRELQAVSATDVATRPVLDAPDPGCGCGDRDAPDLPVDDPLARAYAQAEKRLGRRLYPAERHIDVLRYDADLKRGKERLRVEIQKEVTRSILTRMAGKPGWRPKVTDGMLRELEALYLAGQRHAAREMKSMGYPTQYAAPRVTKALRALIKLMGGMLANIGFRIEREVPKLKVKFDIGTIRPDMIERPSNYLAATLLRAMEKQVPGSLDAASRLVSTAISNGLADTLEDLEGVAPCWIYTAIMDNATCGPCRKLDGRHYKTFAAIMAVLPGGGPNPLCLGDGRCRCRILPCPPEVSR